jgi:lipoprotein-releasing system permease protein
VHFLFAWRYFRGKYAFQAIQIIAWVSVFAIAIGTAALITILSVSNGFSDVVKSLYADFYADVRINPAKGKFFTLTDTQYHALKNIEGVNAISKVVESKALFVKGDYQTVATLKGVDTSYGSINHLKAYLKRGQTAIGYKDRPLLLMGIGVERKLGLFQSMLGDTVQLFSVNRSGKSISQISQLNNLSALQSGAFSVQQEFDESYVFTNYLFAQYLFDLKEDQYSAIECAVQKDKEDKVIAQMQKIIGPDFLLQNKYQQNADLYKIMQLEKWIIFAILALIMIVASFNLVGALTMLVLEKQKDIHVLGAMGAKAIDIQKIFLLLSGIMALIGALLGGIIASIFIILQQQFHFIKLGGSSFVIDYYPIKPMMEDYLAVIGLIILIALLAGWLPARKAAKQLHGRL